MKSLQDLTEILFEQVEKLMIDDNFNDDNGNFSKELLDSELKKSNTLIDLSKQIVEVSSVQLDAVKVAEPNVWKFKHRIVWELAHGEIPANSVICFKDGNKLNCELDNLILLTRGELAIVNKFFGNYTGELTLTGIALGKLKSIVSKKQSK